MKPYFYQKYNIANYKLLPQIFSSDVFEGVKSEMPFFRLYFFDEVI